MYVCRYFSALLLNSTVIFDSMWCEMLKYNLVCCEMLKVDLREVGVIWIDVAQDRDR
jgi:hypothetical protein